MNHGKEEIMGEVTFRQAKAGDEALVLEFIRGIAQYEKMLDEVVATEESIREWMVEKKMVEVIFAEAEGDTVGFALYFQNFSTFVGRAGLYLEDIFVWPELRGKGIGKALLICVAKIAVEEGCSRMDWVCLDWNTPSQKFYQAMGANPHPEWILFRAEKDKLKKLGSME